MIGDESKWELSVNPAKTDNLFRFFLKLLFQRLNTRQYKNISKNQVFNFFFFLENKMQKRINKNC